MKTCLKNMFFAAALLVASVTSALAFEGDWSWEINPEYMLLGDNVDGSVMALGGTNRYCGLPGASYSTMHLVLRNNGLDGEQITWWVDHQCSDGYVRVCVANWQGQQACSTYIDYGWH